MPGLFSIFPPTGLSRRFSETLQDGASRDADATAVTGGSASSRTDQEKGSCCTPFQRLFRSLGFCHAFWMCILAIAVSASVFAILVVSSSTAIDDWHQTMRSTLVDFEFSHDELLTHLSKRLNETLEGYLARASNLTQRSLENTTKQAMGLGNDALRMELKSITGGLLSYLNSFYAAARVADKRYYDLGLNVSVPEDMMVFGRQSYINAYYESLVESVLIDSSRGNSLLLTSGVPYAFLLNGTTGLVSPYQIQQNSSTVLYPSTKCITAEYPCDKVVADPRNGSEYQTATVVTTAHSFRWTTPLLNEESGLNYISLMTPIRMKTASSTNALFGAIGRRLYLANLGSTFQSPSNSKRLYVVDLNGTVIYSNSLSISSFLTEVSTQMATAAGSPDPIVAQSAQALLNRYKNWTAISTAGTSAAIFGNFDFGSIPVTQAIPTLLSNGTVRDINTTAVYLAQIQTLKMLNLQWVLVLVGPASSYTAGLTPIQTTTNQTFTNQSASLVSDIREAQKAVLAESLNTWLQLRLEWGGQYEHAHNRLWEGVVLAIGVGVGVLVVLVVIGTAGVVLSLTVPLTNTLHMLARISLLQLDGMDPNDHSLFSCSPFLEMREMEACILGTIRMLSELRPFIPQHLFAPTDPCNVGGGGPTAVACCEPQLHPDPALESSCNFHHSNSCTNSNPVVSTSDAPSSPPSHHQPQPASLQNQPLPPDRLSQVVPFHDSPTPSTRASSVASSRRRMTLFGFPSGSGASGGGGGIGRISSNATMGLQLGLGLSTVPSITLMLVDVIDFNKLFFKSVYDIENVITVYLRNVIQVVKNHSGVVDRCFGDKIFCHWNAAARQANHQSKACEAAFEIVLRQTQVALSHTGAGRPLTTTIGAERSASVVSSPQWTIPPLAAVSATSPPSSPPRAILVRAFESPQNSNPEASKLRPGSASSSTTTLTSQEGLMMKDFAPSTMAGKDHLATQLIGIKFDARVAIASGPAVVGNVGAENMRSFQVLGPLVNILFFLSKHGRSLNVEVVCDRPTSIQVGHLAYVQPLDIVPFVDIDGVHSTPPPSMHTPPTNQQQQLRSEFATPSVVAGMAGPGSLHSSWDGRSQKSCSTPSSKAPSPRHHVHSRGGSGGSLTVTPAMQPTSAGGASSIPFMIPPLSASNAAVDSFAAHHPAPPPVGSSIRRGPSLGELAHAPPTPSSASARIHLPPAAQQQRNPLAQPPPGWARPAQPTAISPNVALASGGGGGGTSSSLHPVTELTTAPVHVFRLLPRMSAPRPRVATGAESASGVSAAPTPRHHQQGQAHHPPVRRASLPQQHPWGTMTATPTTAAVVRVNSDGDGEGWSSNVLEQQGQQQPSALSPVMPFRSAKYDEWMYEIAEAAYAENEANIEQAVGYIGEGNADKALATLNEFLVRFPNHPIARRLVRLWSARYGVPKCV